MDRDGTISRKLAPGVYLESWEAFEFCPDTVVAMQDLARDGFSFVVITNQSGIARGLVKASEVDRIHRKMTTELAALGITILETYVSPDSPDSPSTTRKPAPGLFHQASREHGFCLGEVLYVGDEVRDCEVASAAGCGMVLLAKSACDRNIPENDRHLSVHESMTDALDDIRSYYRRSSGSPWS